MNISKNCKGGDKSASDALLPMEIEGYVEALEHSTFQELGSLRWIEKHARMEKLTIQAVIEALAENREEIVKDMLISHEKLPILVHDVILVEMWRKQIFPSLLERKPKCTFAMYTILYHEATCINLIETILFHPDAAEALEDAALDLTDYCCRSLTSLVARGSLVPVDLDEVATMDPETDLKNQSKVMLFRIALKCLACLRYLIENLDKVASTVISRLIITGDTPMLLTQILIEKPWRHLNKNGDEVQYDCDQQRWIAMEGGTERFLIGKFEAQAWLGIFQLFMNSRVISTYEIHNYRRNQLLKLRPMLNEITLDQIPILREFEGWLNQVSLGAFPTGAPKTFFIEMLPPIWTALNSELTKNMESIFELQCKELVDSSQNSITEKAQMLANTYDFEAFESVLPPSKCTGCGMPAVKKCGRCKSAWYCKRECQVENWPTHKDLCDKISSNSSKD